LDFHVYQTIEGDFLDRNFTMGEQWFMARRNRVIYNKNKYYTHWKRGQKISPKEVIIIVEMLFGKNAYDGHTDVEGSIEFRPPDQE